MSYILDALRKSDQQRQRGGAPTLQTVQLSASEPKARENWIYALIALFLVAAGIAIGWLQGGQSEPETRTANSLSDASVPGRNSISEPVGRSANAVAAGVTGAAAPLASASPSDLDRQPQRTIRETAIQSASAPVASGAASSLESRTLPEAGGAPKATDAASDRQSTVKAGSPPAAAEHSVMRIGELPESIRQEIPDMHVSLHLYSTRPDNRFVSIDDQMLQEGAYVAPGLKLEKITPDGMEFSFKGYRFRRGVQ